MIWTLALVWTPALECSAARIIERSVVATCANRWFLEDARSSWQAAAHEMLDDDTSMVSSQQPDTSDALYRKSHYAYVDCLEKSVSVFAHTTLEASQATMEAWANCAIEREALNVAVSKNPKLRAAEVSREPVESRLWSTLYALAVAIAQADTPPR